MQLSKFETHLPFLHKKGSSSVHALADKIHSDSEFIQRPLSHLIGFSLGQPFWFIIEGIGGHFPSSSSLLLMHSPVDSHFLVFIGQ